MADESPFPDLIAKISSTKLSLGNYQTWRSGITRLAKSKDLYGFLTGTTPLDSPAAEATDRKLKGLLLSTISEVLLCEVMHLQTSSEIWGRLPDFVRERRDGLDLYRKFEYYGPEAYPFGALIEDSIQAEDEALRKEVSSLRDLVEVDYASPLGIHKFNSKDSELPISHLEGKVVGFYLVSDLTLLPKLLDVYEQCTLKELGFEVVIVFPNPKNEEITNMILKNYPVCHEWWCLPFNASVSRRFKRVAYDYYSNRGYPEALLMAVPVVLGDTYYPAPGIGPILEGTNILVDRHGAVVIEHGVDAYPFTKEGLIQQTN